MPGRLRRPLPCYAPGQWGVVGRGLGGVFEAVQWREGQVAVDVREPDVVFERNLVRGSAELEGVKAELRLLEVLGLAGGREIVCCF